MVVVLRAFGFRIAMYRNDHEPAHVHVYGDGEAKINLFGPDGKAQLITNSGIKANDLRRAFQAVNARRTFLIEQWRLLHGGED